MGNTTQEELRRAPRVRVCCRVDVQQPHGVWSAVTQDLSSRGCRIATAQVPRLGARLAMSLSSDLFPDELSTVGEVVWVNGEQLGILFLEEARRQGSISPAKWLEHVVEHGRRDGPPGTARQPDGVVPVVRSPPPGGAAIPIDSRRRSG